MKSKRPDILFIGGSIGAGKTTLAYRLAARVPNAVIIENDQIRRELLGFPLNYFMNHDVDGSFSDENNTRVEREIDRRTKDALAQGKQVIRCHVFITEDTLQNYMYDYRSACQMHIYLSVPEHLIRERLQKRKHERETLPELTLEQGHSSDADENVLHKLPVIEKAPKGWIAVDASLSADMVFEQVYTLFTTGR